VSSAEIESLSKHLQAKIGEILAAVAPLSDAQINQAPLIPGANSCFVITTHVLGNVRAFVLGIACGMDLHRDRTAEFRSRGTGADLAAEGERLSDEVRETLAGLDPAKLDERLFPSQELWGEGETREISRREALIHPFQNAAIHLGQVLLTVDWVRAERA
jgi:uncharacterized damage-inducible protein DinB